MSEKTQYVVGFLFNDDLTKVVLIEKNRPLWQAGKYNGVGGHIEADESPREAMEREFFEETGMLFNSWDMFGKIEVPNAEIFCFCAKAYDLNYIKTITDENVYIVNIEKFDDIIFNNALVLNLTWLVPMAIWRLSGHQTYNESFKLFEAHQ